ncbi:cyclophane-containing RiPP N-acetyltransferase HaaN [Streptomyces venezuelae]|uniref:cyclophane-containing RiPP N-acetyltransferase HaaN n=1 Tax=Streptomyces venezuelae TaxID=54571 RepID=UPI00332E3AAC
MPSTVAIRPADKHDIVAVAELIEEIERFYGSTDIQPLDERVAQVGEALFGSPPLGTALLAEDAGVGLVGLAVYTFLWPASGSSHSLFLKELYVRETVRRQGVGARLMDELRTLADARPGCSRVEWMTDRGNAEARAFYGSLGFEEYDGKIVYRL